MSSRVRGFSADALKYSIKETSCGKKLVPFPEKVTTLDGSAFLQRLKSFFPSPSGCRRNARQCCQTVAAGAVGGIDQAFGVWVPGRGDRIAIAVSKAALDARLAIPHPKLPVSVLLLAES